MMTRAELETALKQLQAENAALRAELDAQRSASGAAPSYVPASLLAYLLEDTHTAIVLANADGCVQWVNKGFTALCGLELAEVLGLQPASFLWPTMRDPVTLAYIQDSQDNQTAFQYEVANPRPGSTGWIRVRVQPVAVAEQGHTHLIGMLEDITEWKEAQISLIASEKRFRDLAENVPGVLYEWWKNSDGTFHFDYISPNVLAIFGVQADEFSRVSDFIHPEEVEGFLTSLDYATRNHLPWVYEGRLVVPGQPVRWMRGSAIVTSHDETWLKYSGILLDITPLKLAETAVRESNRRRQLALKGFGDGAWEYHLRTNAMCYSKEYKVMLGYSDEEFEEVAGAWENIVHPDDQAAAQHQYLAYLRGEVPYYSCEIRLRCRDGRYKWVLSRCIIAERADNGEPLVVSGSNTDISELKKVQDALEASSRRLSTVIANFQDGLVLEDEARHIVLTNEAFCRMLKTRLVPTQLARKDVAWLTRQTQAYVKDPGQYMERIAALLEAKTPVRGDIIEVLDGRIIQRDFTPVYDRGQYIGQLWKFQDVTVRTKAEEDLRHREEKYRGIIENMSLGLVEVDLDDYLLYANQSFCDMTGFCDEELTGQRLSSLLLSGNDLKLMESKLAVRQQGIADSYEIVIKTKTGELKWLLVSGAPLYDDNQRLIGSISICLDVNPQKQLEASLREAKARADSSTSAKQDFLANMSHEIRTPMNVILGMSQLLTKTPLNGSQTSYLNAITASAENLLVIINDILDLSKIESGRVVVEQIGFHPARVCTQVEKTLQYKAEEKGLSFVTVIGPGVPTVLLGDPYRIAQILLNLAGNAVKFTEKGTVRVACMLVAPPQANEALVEFLIQDTGIGIEAEYLAQVFDNFSQEDSSVTRRFGGTGLGLGISKKLVELLGGELHIESRKNHGTTSRFTLRLPVGIEAAVPQKSDGDGLSGLQHALRGKRVLLVEDNTFNRMLAAILLTNAGLDVTEAINGEVAVELAHHQPPFDLVLMDVQMPVMNGYEATALLRQQLGLGLPIIALTANATNGEREKCLAAGMNDYLTKPFQEATLIKMVYDWVIGKK